jgi:hypothetical protein
VDHWQRVRINCLPRPCPPAHPPGCGLSPTAGHQCKQRFASSCLSETGTARQQSLANAGSPYSPRRPGLLSRLPLPLPVMHGLLMLTSLAPAPALGRAAGWHYTLPRMPCRKCSGAIDKVALAPSPGPPTLELVHAWRSMAPSLLRCAVHYWLSRCTPHPCHQDFLAVVSLAKCSALLAETLHSIADIMNQVLLRMGVVQSQRAPTTEYPYGFLRYPCITMFMLV